MSIELMFTVGVRVFSRSNSIAWEICWYPLSVSKQASAVGVTDGEALGETLGIDDGGNEGLALGAWLGSKLGRLDGFPLGSMLGSLE